MKNKSKKTVGIEQRVEIENAVLKWVLSLVDYSSTRPLGDLVKAIERHLSHTISLTPKRK